MSWLEETHLVKEDVLAGEDSPGGRRCPGWRRLTWWKKMSWLENTHLVEEDVLAGEDHLPVFSVNHTQLEVYGSIPGSQKDNKRINNAVPSSKDAEKNVT